MNVRNLIVAINAKYIHSNLAIYSIRAYCKKCGINLDIAEFTINQKTDSMLKEIYKKKPDFIGFSCYIWNIEFVLKLAGEVKRVLPDVTIWLGGPEVSYDAANVIADNDFVDGVMIGEGEITFSRVIKAYENGDDVSQIPGVAVRGSIKVHQAEYMNMDDIPFPYENFKDMEHRIIYYESSRGCPYSCSYCLSSVDKRVRFRSMELVKKELKVFIDANVPQVKFVDRTFNCDRKRTKEIWEFIRDNDNGITNFHFEISADIITDEEIELLHSLRPGLVQLEIGVQTTNEKTVQAIRRKMDFEKLSYVVNRIHETGNVHQHLDLIAGLPYEDYASFRNSFNDVYALKPEQLQLGFLKVLKGSYMQEQAYENDIVYSSYPPYEVLSTPWLPYSDVLRLKGVEEMVEVYYNSGQFVTTVKYMEKYFDTPFDMFEYMAEYYEENGLYDCGHSRIARYNILIDALGDRMELLPEIMTYDLYLRENMKTRPSFAVNLEEEYNRISAIYTDEQNIRELLPEYEEYTTKQMQRMTHVDRFSFDILEFARSGKINRQETYLLFDYKKVNPVDKAARVIKV
ncbi:MAG: B12-binding domain-containing radical SAM protein [Lachnospiraceae bacterium]|nr:B12-binding domain-containing radical SAM protein [Lachnospiraceae bacterium]MDD6858921.1 B12-binding domain-containing radical SAM protein [Lachnospiraceae bacterium]